MNYSTYQVKCKKCKKSDKITITSENQILWGDNKNIISGRRRLDSEWGWECLCGNNTILTKQEKTFISDKQNPEPKEISQIVQNLKPEKNKFDLVKL